MQSTRDYNDATAERSAKSRLKLLLPVLHIIGRRSSSSSSSCCSFGNKRRIHCISYLLLLLLTELPGWPPPLTVICWPNSFRIAVDNLICIVPIYARLMDNSDTKPGQSWVKQLQHAPAPAAVAASSPFLSYQLICIYTRVYFCTICVRRSLSASV